MTHRSRASALIVFAVAVSACEPTPPSDAPQASSLTRADTLVDTSSICPAADPAIAGQTRMVSVEFPGGCDDGDALQQKIFDLGPTGKLIVDRTCTIDRRLLLPARFTLAGVGKAGNGVLVFTHDGVALDGCLNGDRAYVTIENIQIYGPHVSAGSAPHSVGIRFFDHEFVKLDDVRLSNFHTGLRVQNTYSGLVRNANISNNHDGVELRYQSNAWTFDAGNISQSDHYGVNVWGPGESDPVVGGVTSNDITFRNVRFESNAHGAVRTAAVGVRLVDDRFEGNGHALAFGDHVRAVEVTHDAVSTRLHGNYFDVDCISDEGTDTKRAFSIPADKDTELCAGPVLVK